ncbi:hypothetical protein AA106556_0309 [Neokomagataea tanensis NBRC 106556]|uniref:Uncharacterized protein n=1 Tax=Neokomagataea tanensis NBRC 106556 TaxID=1223519 RepID=A0ABQ0QGK2_9PROT|nr:hypothetical protein AA106556_0309 [Neokomagataea tanensis NBRC 106556]
MLAGLSEGRAENAQIPFTSETKSTTFHAKKRPTGRIYTNSHIPGSLGGAI